MNFPLSNEQASKLALLVLYAMDQFCAEPASLAPAPDPRIGADGWKIVGYLTAKDCIWRSAAPIDFGDTVCYGFLAQRIDDPKSFALVIRGTKGILEWIEDGQFLPVAHPVAGTVEAGFWGIHLSMEYRPVSGGAVPAAEGINAEVSDGRLIVLGHSLGAPLATYLTFDLAAPELLGGRVQAALYASPRPGNAAFGAAFSARTAGAYQLWNYSLDVVPHVPFGPDYEDLPNATWITPATAMARICFSLDCHHHITSYAAMLDDATENWSALPAQDQAFAACIKGPAAA